MADILGAARAADSDDDDSVEDTAALWSDWREDAAVGQAGEEEPAQSLFSAAVLPSAAAAIAYDREQHAFDMAQFAAQVSTALRSNEASHISCLQLRVRYQNAAR